MFGKVYILFTGDMIASIPTLDEGVLQHVQLGLGPSLKNKRTVLHSYMRFCSACAFTPFPANRQQLQRYAQYLSTRVKSFETIQSYVSGVSQLHEILHLQAPKLDDYFSVLLMRGIKRSLAKAVKQATPITPELLMKLSDVVDLEDDIEMVSWCAVLLGFALFLRASNLVPEGSDKFDSQKQFCQGDFKLAQGIMVVDIKWSKTIQYKEKVLHMPVLPFPFKQICPVFWFHQMIARFPAVRDSPAFGYPVAGLGQSLGSCVPCLTRRSCSGCVDGYRDCKWNLPNILCIHYGVGVLVLRTKVICQRK